MQVYVYNKGTGKQLFRIKHVKLVTKDAAFWTIEHDDMIEHIGRDEYMITVYGY